MNKHNFNPYNSLVENEGKYNTFLNQKITIFHYLKENIATASMISEATSIPQKNVTRYKRNLELAGLLFEVKKTYCEKTGFKASYLTTNKEIVQTIGIQLNLFENEE